MQYFPHYPLHVAGEGTLISVELCGPHVAISPVVLRSSNALPPARRSGSVTLRRESARYSDIPGVAPLPLLLLLLLLLLLRRWLLLLRQSVVSEVILRLILKSSPPSQAFTAGRVRFIVTDLRSESDDPSLPEFTSEAGDKQKAPTTLGAPFT